MKKNNKDIERKGREGREGREGDAIEAALKAEAALDAVGFLQDSVGRSIEGLGADDTSVKQLTEANLALTFSDWMCEGVSDYFKLASSGDLYLFNGRYYERHDEIVLNYIVKTVMKQHMVGKVYQVNSHQKIVRESKICMQSNPSSRYSPNRNYAVFDNGVFELSTGKMRGFSTDYCTDLIFDFDYDDTVSYPLWDEFICKTIPNPEMRLAFQQFCGALMIDREEYKIEYVLYLIGSGRNGKSVVTAAIANVFGDKLISSYSPDQLFKDSNAMYNRADVDGKLANFSDDVKASDYSGGDFKSFVSGASFPARHIYGKPFKMSRVPFMICCVNEMPPTTDDTFGHFRRLLPIYCPNAVSKADVDPNLKAKLCTQKARQAIFNWVYEGYKSVIANNGKITVGASIEEAQTEIMSNANSARRWIQDCKMVAVQPTSRDDRRWKPMKEWMALYTQWCKELSEMPKTQNSVGRIFRSMGFVSDHRNGGVWYCIGSDTTFQDGFADEDLPF